MYGILVNMNPENITPEPSLNDFMIRKQAMIAKWTSEGNIDSEKDVANQIEREVLDRIISAKEGIERLEGIDAARIQR